MRPNLRTRKVSLNDIPTYNSVITTSPLSATTPASNSQLKYEAYGGSRPQTRPRGMTDNTGIRPSLRKDGGRPSLSRQSSFSRSFITPPETSPPSQELPPVPSLKYLSVPPKSDGSPSDPGSSSSSLSFASSISESELVSKAFVEDKRLQNIRDQVRAAPEPRTKSPTGVLRGAFSPTLSRQPTTANDRPSLLRKMPSQPSLQNKLIVPPSAYPDDDHCLGVDTITGSPRSLKKQRPFHRARGPVPPVPSLRHANSFTPSEMSVSQPMDSPKDKEKERRGEKRESMVSLSKRRFLPGSIRRGSASHAATFTFDEDTGSVIIPLDLDGCSPPRTNPFGSPGVESMMLPATSTFYDDLATSPTAGSTAASFADVQSQDAGPQQILSTAQLLRLEEMLDNSESEASTGSSSRTSPTEFGLPRESSSTDSPPFEEFGFSNRSPRKKNSWTGSIISTSTILSSTLSDKTVFSDKVETGSTLSFFDQQQYPGYLPRTTSGNTPLDSGFSTKRSHSPFASSSQSTISMGIESTFGIEPNQPFSGLTPPPRRRPKVLNNMKGSGNRGSMTHIQPLSPPPLRRNPTSTSASSRSTSPRSSTVSSTKSPPPAFKSDLPIKGIVKKPSFLDIYDDSEADAGPGAQVMIGGNIHQRNTSISSIDDSFLDLGRENNSFDTIRTLSVESPG